MCVVICACMCVVICVCMCVVICVCMCVVICVLFFCILLSEVYPSLIMIVHHLVLSLAVNGGRT